MCGSIFFDVFIKKLLEFVLFIFEVVVCIIVIKYDVRVSSWWSCCRVGVEWLWVNFFMLLRKVFSKFKGNFGFLVYISWNLRKLLIISWWFILRCLGLRVNLRSRLIMFEK